MEYFAIIYDGTDFVDVEVGERDYHDARDCRSFFLTKNKIEEKFNLVLENYIDLERELLSISFMKAVQFGVSWSEGADLRQVVNRKLSNLLSSCRAYLDQTRRALKHRYGSRSDQLVGFKEETHSQYESRLGYRLMEGLRNHAQHCELPVSSITLSKHREPRKGADRINSIRISASLDDLRSAGKVKNDVLDEVAVENDSIHLSPYVRDYVTGLIKVQMRVRALLKDETKNQLAAFERLVGKMPESDRRHYKAIRWKSVTDGGRMEEEVVLLEEFLSRTKELERRNMYPGELKTMVVTSNDTE
jgi:hypothetical protein